MVIYELLIIVIIFWIISIFVRKDLFSPESLLCLSYIFAIMCAIYNIDNWGINLKYNTLVIIIVGIFSFFCTSMIYFLFHKKKGVKNITKRLSWIELNSGKLLFLNFVSLIIMIIYSVYFIKAIGGFSALSNFSYSMEMYRSKTMIYNMVLIPSWINFLTKLCRAICYVYTFVLINNLIINKNAVNKSKINFLPYLIGIITYIPLTLMSGGRYDLIVYVIYIIVIFSILFTINNQKKLNPLKILKIGLILIAVMLIFSSSRNLVGRTSESSSLDYVTEYFGGSIEIFDQYLQENYEKADYFGQETFAGIRKLLFQLKFIDEQGLSEGATEFRKTSNNKVIGNVYTGFRKPYHDFGIIGMIILQAFLAIIFNKLYYNCFYKKEKNGISFRIIITGTIFYCLVLHSYSEAFYSTVVSFNHLMLFLIIYVLIKFLENIEVKI